MSGIPTQWGTKIIRCTSKCQAENEYTFLDEILLFPRVTRSFVRNIDCANVALYTHTLLANIHVGMDFQYLGKTNKTDNFCWSSVPDFLVLPYNSTRLASGLKNHSIQHSKENEWYLILAHGPFQHVNASKLLRSWRERCVSAQCISMFMLLMPRHILLLSNIHTSYSAASCEYLMKISWIDISWMHWYLSHSASIVSLYLLQKKKLKIFTSALYTTCFVTCDYRINQKMDF